MAEETLPNPDDTLARVEQYVQGLVTQYLKEAQQAQPAQAQPTQPQAQPSYEDQLKQYVNPVVNDNTMVRQAHFKAFDVDDKLNFYTQPVKDGEVDPRSYHDQVETAFKTLADAGRATSRRDILRWIIGDEYAKDPVAFNSKQAELKKAQVERARMAGDFGSGGVGRESRDNSFPTMEEFSKLNSTEQAKLLEGMTF